MDRSLLKNIIILILVLVNGFLLGALVLRHTAASATRHQMEEQLVALFAADGMELDPDVISQDTPPSSLTLARDPQRERDAAAFFLGSGMTQSEQSGDTCYNSAAGAARFRSNGDFDIVGSLGNGEALCRKFCKTFSFSEPDFIRDDDGQLSAVAVCRSGKLPVYNCKVTFTFDQDTLLTVSGTLLPSEGTAAAEERELLSAAAALTTFQQTRREGSMVASAVTDLYLCYELQGSTASALSLVPAWCVVTDTANYYVNASTGAVTSG